MEVVHIPEVINYTDLARIMLQEAGYPELVPFVQQSRRPGHFGWHGHLEVPLTLDRVNALATAWHLVHMAYCRTVNECPFIIHDREMWPDEQPYTPNADTFHRMPTFEYVCEVYTDWTEMVRKKKEQK